MSTAAHFQIDEAERWARSTPVPDIGRIDKREAVAKNDSDVLTRIEGLDMQLIRQFVKHDELTAQQLEVGVRREAIWSPWIEAAYKTWKKEQVGEAPIGRPIP